MNGRLGKMAGRCGVASAIGVLVLLLAHPADARQFRTLELRGLPALQHGAAAWGDIDGDGDMDVVIMGNLLDLPSRQPLMRAYLNDGDFVDEVEPAEGGPPVFNYGVNFRLADLLPEIWRGDLAMSDFDGDGDLDVAAAGQLRDGTPRTYVLENRGPPGFFVERFALIGVSDGAVAWGDYDNDGDPDLAVSGIGSSGEPLTVLYENRSRTDGDFVIKDAGFTGLSKSKLAWGDYDNDDDLDLLATGVTGDPAWAAILYRNDGFGVFTDVSADLCRMYGTSLSWGDYDSDGDLDVLAAGGIISPFLVEGEICIRENVAGTLVPPQMTILGRFEGDDVSGRYSGSASWGDFNNDGRLDFLITGLKNPTSARRGQVYEQVHPGLFVAPGNEDHSSVFLIEGFGAIPGGAHGTTAWVDYDGDLDLDIMSQGFEFASGASVIGHQNYLSTYARNQRPQPPSSLTATVDGASVRLAWSPGSDFATPVASLSYNVRVGSTPGGIDVAPPMADPQTGVRLLSAPGNAGQGLSWTLRDLTPGTYHAAVQSIDTSYAGSTFSEEITFFLE